MDALQGFRELLALFCTIIVGLLYLIFLFGLLFWPFILLFILITVIISSKRKKDSPARSPILSTRTLTDVQLLLGLVAALLAFVYYGLLDLSRWLAKQWRKHT
jgi:hypothetical protein